MSDSKIYVKYEDDQLYVSNDNVTWSDSCDFVTDISCQGKMEWIPVTDELTIDCIQVHSNPNRIFRRPPHENSEGIWTAQLNRKQKGAADYDIEFSVNGVEKPAFDPIISVKAPTE